MIVFPAIDLYQNACVRLHQGKYDQVTIYHEDPVRQAIEFEASGCTHLHLVDLEAAKTGKATHLHILREIKKRTNLHIDYGGGIRSEENAIACLNAGADQINVGTFAIHNSSRFYHLMKEVGPEKIILSADRKGEMLKTHGWQQDAQVTFWECLEGYNQKGGTYVTSTDISKDGTLEGIDLSGYLEILQRFPHFKVIVSGGVKNENDILIVRHTGIYGIITGKAIYEGNIDLRKLNKKLNRK